MKSLVTCKSVFFSNMVSLCFVFSIALTFSLFSQSMLWLWSSNSRVNPLKSGDCQCYVPKHGIFNGLVLNKFRRENNCKLNLYYCARNNYCGEPILLLDCTKNFGCYYDSMKIDCRCKGSLKKVYKCGNKLIGSQCFSDLLYFCNENSEAEYVGVCEKETVFETPKSG